MKRILAVALVVACSSATDDYVRKSKAIEAKVSLHGLAKRASSFVVEHGAYPKGTVGPTPAKPCCQGAGGRCAPSPGDWASPVWAQLDFAMNDPARFQYSYSSDGKTFAATATADLSCDGKITTFTVSGKLGTDGTPVVDESQLDLPQ